MKILRALADEAPLTIYAIARKSGVAVSLVHRVVRNPKTGFEPQRIVKVYSEGTWRTG
jgi:ribosomal protein S25